MTRQLILIVILYFRFPSYKHLMAFWNLIEAATAKMVRVTRAKKTYSTSTESPLTVTDPLSPGQVPVGRELLGGVFGVARAHQGSRPTMAA